MMAATRDHILQTLDNLGVGYECFLHPAITTMEEGAAIARQIGFMPCKNLFLVNKQKQYFLLVLQGGKRFSARDVAQQISSSHLSLASLDSMGALLHAERGAASILGVIFDEKQQVHVLIDKDVLNSEFITCHPCENTCTVKIHTAEVISTLLPATNHGYLAVDIP